jgi:hypothetical protein
VSAGLSQPIPIMPWISARTLIVISYLKVADTNNNFWYRLATADTKKNSFLYRINGIGLADRY